MLDSGLRHGGHHRWCAVTSGCIASGSIDALTSLPVWVNVTTEMVVNTKDLYAAMPADRGMRSRWIPPVTL